MSGLTAAECVRSYGDHTFVSDYATRCARCGTTRTQAQADATEAVSGPEDACQAVFCPSPEFAGREREPQGHIRMPDGRAYHFACRARMVRDLLST